MYKDVDQGLSLPKREILVTSLFNCTAATQGAHNVIHLILPKSPVNLLIPTRGLRVEHVCYPTRTRSIGQLPVPVPDPYSKLLPNPTRTRGYTRTRHCQAFPCIVYVPATLIA